MSRYLKFGAFTFKTPQGVLIKKSLKANLLLNEHMNVTYSTYELPTSYVTNLTWCK